MSPAHDALTGSMSRAALHQLLEDLISQRAAFAVVLFDIDRFKLINYGFGDGCGDVVLQEIAHAIQGCVKPDDQIARWAGQQFLCVLRNNDTAQAAARAEQLRALIETLLIRHDNNHIHVTASFGVAAFPNDGDIVRRLLASAEAALYQAKEFGRNRVIEASVLPQQVYGVGSLLDRALREQRIVPAYQPIVDLRTGKIVAEEALARLITPEGDVLEADAFIDVAQKLQFTYKIDQAIITSTCNRFVRALGMHSPRVQFVNISGNLLRHPHVVRELLESVEAFCQKCGQWSEPRKPLVIEVTEREFLGDVASARAALEAFVEFGLSLALDDFGSGYSSFQYLADLPFTYLKIEGGLIQRLREPRVRVIVQGMQDTARQLGLITLAERVENAEVADILRDIGVDWAQGHYYYKAALDSEYLHRFDFAIPPPAATGRVAMKKFKR